MTTYTNYLTNAIIIFLGSIVFAGLLIAVFNSPFETIMSTAAGVGTSSEAATSRTIISDAWGVLPFIVVVIGLIQLVGAAAKESQI